MATKEQRNGSGAVKGALIGTVIGAAAALLLAPKSGRELRADLKSKAGTAGANVKTHASEWAAAARESAKNVGAHASAVAARLQELAPSAAAQRTPADAVSAELAAAEAAAADAAPDAELNGTMVRNERDAKRLGDEMKSMKTNSQLQADGLVPDPIQVERRDE